MGKVIALKPYVVDLPEALPERAPRRVPLGTIVKTACDQLYAEPIFRQFVAGVNPETSFSGSLAYDTHHAILTVLKHVEKAHSLEAIPQVEMKVGVAIRDWMRESGISRRSRRLAAREQMRLASAAAE
jgi:hypothetical protein